MDLVDWQQRFERWILTHHAQDDAAHDLSHFRRVWATATQLAAGEEVDRLVLLTACYFHDIVSLPKNHPERSRSSMMAAEKTLAILQSAFADFPADRYPAVSPCHRGAQLQRGDPTAHAGGENSSGCRSTRVAGSHWSGEGLRCRRRSEYHLV